MKKGVSKTILIADDDMSILDALQIMLEDVGYAVITTPDGKEVEKLLDRKPDVILLDIWMSGMNGQDICRLIKKAEHARHIPVIMISANRDTKDIALQCGADDFITKPFEMNDLLEKISLYIH